jgi:4-hydroxy-tetrahydrodipicolinate synthase
VSGPLLDAFDMADVDAFLADIEDLLLPQDQLP